MTNSTDSSSCLIVGAGMAGLAAANTLQNTGWDVTVLDKGRGVGGRAATRRFGGATFDHGAQFFTVRDDRFRAYVDHWLENNVVTRWSYGFPSNDDQTTDGTHPRYRGVAGMTHMPKVLAASLNVRVSTTVTQIDHTGQHWQITAQQYKVDEPQTYTADALLMTPPAEQTLTLMRSGNVSLPTHATDALAAIEFDPNFSVLLLLDSSPNLPEPGAMTINPGEPIEWIADNEQKGISMMPALTIRTGPDFTRQHYDDHRDTVAQLVIKAAQPYLNGANVISYQVQRWRYSNPTVTHPEPTLFVDTPGPVAFAGDAFGSHGRVEGAFLSGLAAADALSQ